MSPLRRKVRHLECTLRQQFWREMGRKFSGLFAPTFFGSRTIKDLLMGRKSVERE
jgi:hypothetical protein